MSWCSCRRMRSSHRAMFWWFQSGWAREICWTSSLTRCVTFWSRFKKRRSHRRMGWEQPVFEFNKITGSAAAKPFTMPIFTSYPLLVGKRLELPRQEESSRRRNTSRSRISCARRGRNEQGEVTRDQWPVTSGNNRGQNSEVSGSQDANFTAGGAERAKRVHLGKPATRFW